MGTFNKSRRELPEAVCKSKANLYDTKLLKTGNTTLTMYQDRKKKNVLILSTMHPSIEIGVNEKQTPETIKFYHETKYGVDILDQMARLYKTRTPTRRWPVHVF